MEPTITSVQFLNQEAEELGYEGKDGAVNVKQLQTLERYTENASRSRKGKGGR